MVEVSDSKPEPPAGPNGPIQSVSFTQRKASGVAKRTYGAEDGADSGAGVRSESVRCTKRSLTISSDKFGPFGLAGGLPAELQHVVVAAEWLALFQDINKKVMFSESLLGCCGRYEPVLSALACCWSGSFARAAASTDIVLTIGCCFRAALWQRSSSMLLRMPRTASGTAKEWP